MSHNQSGPNQGSRTPELPSVNVILFFIQVKHQTRVSYKCAAAGCEFMSLEAADMRRHMALEHVLVVKNKDGTGMTDEDETLS